MNDWQIKKLGDIGKVSMCKRVLKSQTTKTGDIPFYKIGTFGKEPNAYISLKIYNEFRKKFSFPKKGDILISASGTIGRRVKYDGEPAYFQDSNIVWVDNNEDQVLNDYLFYFYGVCNWNATKGATISRLYNNDLRQIEIPFPKSLPEQKRLVALIDDLFEKLEKAKENAEKNLLNAKELFDSHLNLGIFGGTKSGWVKYSLSEISENLDRRRVPITKKDRIEGGIPYYGASGVVDYVDDYIFDEDLLLVSEDGANLLARTYPIAFSVSGKIWVNNHAHVLKFKEKVTQKFVEYYLNSISLAPYVSGMAQPKLNQASLNGIEIFLPKLSEQEKILDSLDELFSGSKKLGAIYKQKNKNLEELKQSILHQAFTGKL